MESAKNTSAPPPLAPVSVRDWNRLLGEAKAGITEKIEVGRKLAEHLAKRNGFDEMLAYARMNGLTVEDAAVCVSLALLERGAWRVPRVVAADPVPPLTPRASHLTPLGEVAP